MNCVRACVMSMREATRIRLVSDIEINQPVMCMRDPGRVRVRACVRACVRYPTITPAPFPSVRGVARPCAAERVRVRACACVCV
jgi:hypothetical protein